MKSTLFSKSQTGTYVLSTKHNAGKYTYIHKAPFKHGKCQPQRVTGEAVACRKVGGCHHYCVSESRSVGPRLKLRLPIMPQLYVSGHFKKQPVL